MNATFLHFVRERQLHWGGNGRGKTRPSPPHPISSDISDQTDLSVQSAVSPPRSRESVSSVPSVVHSPEISPSYPSPNGTQIPSSNRRTFSIPYSKKFPAHLSYKLPKSTTQIVPHHVPQFQKNSPILSYKLHQYRSTLKTSSLQHTFRSHKSRTNPDPAPILTTAAPTAKSLRI
jgi:hypothetical protein